jgi:hypothetical protein
MVPLEQSIARSAGLRLRPGPVAIPEGNIVARLLVTCTLATIHQGQSREAATLVLGRISLLHLLRL